MPLPKTVKITLSQDSYDMPSYSCIDLLEMPMTGNIWLRFGPKGKINKMTKADALKLSEVLAKMANS